MLVKWHKPMSAYFLLFLSLTLLFSWSPSVPSGSWPRWAPSLSAAPIQASQKTAGEAKESSELIKLRTELVTLTVTVTDAASRAVTDLSRNSFEVFDDQVKQQIEYFSAEDVPLSVGIIFDVSGSMQGKTDYARAALKAFLQNSHQQDDYFLICFNERVQSFLDLVDGDTLMKKLTVAEPQGGTALYDAVYLGLEKIKRSRAHKRALLIISDGQNNSSLYTSGELHQLLQESDVLVYGLGVYEPVGATCGRVCQRAGQVTLTHLTQVTGGKAFFTYSADELEQAAQAIALELRRQYSLGYAPTTAPRDGRWHKLKVRLIPAAGRRKAKVRAREGYYATP